MTSDTSELAAAALQLMERNRRKAISMLPVISASERDLVLRIAEEVSGLCSKLGIDYVFKANFDKANRSSGKTFRGPGAEEGLANLAKVRERLWVPVLTDIDESHQASVAAQAVVVLQIPAFLCRQTDLLEAAAKAVVGTDKAVNVKKGQFLAPSDMTQVVNKLAECGLEASSVKLWLTERGTSFGYNTLVVDYLSLPQLQALGCPVIFDATHAVQQPGRQGSSSGGQREFVAPLARAAMAVGVEGLFLEVHPDPENALSDGPNKVPMHRLEALLRQLLTINYTMADGIAVSTLLGTHNDSQPERPPSALAASEAPTEASHAPDGITVTLLSGGRSGAIEQRARHLDIEHCRTGVGDKQSGLELLRSELAMTREQTAFLGDDLTDLAVRPVSGLLITPADASRGLRRQADLVLTSRRGEAVRREYTEALLNSSGSLDLSYSRRWREINDANGA